MPKSLFALILLLSLPAWGTEGAIEINQARALAGGVTAADTPGFPVTLVPGRYVSTGDLVPPVDTQAIGGSADHVSIDLAGFQIVGSTAGGFANGIAFQGSDWEIRNGTIRGFSMSGISQANAGDVEVRLVGLRVTNNGTIGASVFDRSTVEDCFFEGNGSDGIVASGAGVRVIRTTAQNNGGSGIIVSGDSAVVTDSQAIGNGQLGISVGAGSTIENASASGNQGLFAISCGEGCRVRGASAWGNATNGLDAGDASIVSDVMAFDNGAIGVRCRVACNASRIVSVGNTTAALSLGTDSGFTGCVLRGGTTVSGGIDLGQNLCNGSTTCP